MLNTINGMNFRIYLMWKEIRDLFTRNISDDVVFVAIPLALTPFFKRYSAKSWMNRVTGGRRNLPHLNVADSLRIKFKRVLLGKLAIAAGAAWHGLAPC